MLPETEFIKNLLRQPQPGQVSGLIKGIGDDCAVLGEKDGRVTLLTVDTLVDRVHFDLSWHPPFLLGRKAAAVNISDIAAMGGIPRFALLSVAADWTRFRGPDARGVGDATGVPVISLTLSSV